MTVLTKPSLNATKPDEIKSPLVLDVEEGGEHVVFPPPPWAPTRRSTGALLFMSIVAVLVAVTGVSCGLMLYRQYLRSTRHHYQAYCAIPYETREDVPVTDLIDDPNFNELMPLRWSPDPDVIQIIGTTEKQNEALLNSLREEFDIRGRVERIRVYDNGRSVSFIHDFDGNVSGIVDQDRCFLMELDPNLVLAPETLVLGIERDQPFDVSLVHSTLRAVLPALQQAATIAECLDKPTYKLDKAQGIRKRSAAADPPPHDYVHFAGQKVHEIEIDNLAELLQAEQQPGQRANDK